jgi:Fic family protein
MQKWEPNVEIEPLDGNGRVARLMSHTMLRESLDTKGLWSVARGLARNEFEYKRHLMACDAPRKGDCDGRGTLSETALARFTRFFLQCCIDQVTFMEGLMKPDRLRDRILIWAEEEMRSGNLPTKSDAVLKAVLLQGDLPRADVVMLLGTTDRSARRVTSALIDSGALTSVSTRAATTAGVPSQTRRQVDAGALSGRIGKLSQNFALRIIVKHGASEAG